MGLPDSQINREDLVMESVDERDCDLLLVEELCASNEFLRLFLNALPDDAIRSIPATPPDSFVARHSINREDGSGETDIEVEVTWTNEKHQKTSVVLLIENKIDAPFQPDQPERYAAYRDLLMETSPATLALTVLSAPGRYLGSTDAQFDARVSYEAIESYFNDRALAHPDTETQRRSLYRAQWFRQAIHKHRRGYTPTIDREVTDFWNSYWRIADQEFNELRMESPGPKPQGSTWVRFMRALAASDGLGWVDFNHKLNNGKVEILLERMAGISDSVRQQLFQLLEQPMYLRNAGRSVAIGLDVPAVNPGERFGPQADRVRLGLAAAMTMRSWWETNVQTLEQLLPGHGSN